MNLGPPSPDAPGESAGGVLVVGYGNTLRTDDGVGWHAAVLLAADPRLAGHARLADARLAGVKVLAAHQLTPELAFDMSRAALVILIDASIDDPPGVITVRSLADDDDVARGGPGAGTSPGAGAGQGAGGGPGASSHHVGPGELLAVALELYGATPAAFAVRVGVASMEVGETLSPMVAAALPAVIDTVVDLIDAHRRPRVARDPG